MPHFPVTTLPQLSLAWSADLAAEMRWHGKFQVVLGIQCGCVSEGLSVSLSPQKTSARRDTQTYLASSMPDPQTFGSPRQIRRGLGSDLRL